MVLASTFRLRQLVRPEGDGVERASVQSGSFGMVDTASSEASSRRRACRAGSEPDVQHHLEGVKALLLGRPPRNWGLHPERAVKGAASLSQSDHHDFMY